MAALSAPDTEPVAAPAASITNPDLGAFGRVHAVAAVAAVHGIVLMRVFFLWIVSLDTFLKEDILPAFLEVNPNVVSILSTFTYAGEEFASWGFGHGGNCYTPVFPEGSAVKMTFFKLVDAIVTQLHTVWNTHAGRENTDEEKRSIFIMVVDQIVKHFWTDSREYDEDNA